MEPGYENKQVSLKRLTEANDSELFRGRQMSRKAYSPKPILSDYRKLGHYYALQR